MRRGVWYAVAVVFSISLAVRALFDALFQTVFGAHATNHMETWLYTGVMEGTKVTGGGLSDPVVWLLRAIGIFIPEGYAFYAVMATSAVMSSLTAAAILLLASELYDLKTGFAAGLVYGGMVEPIALSMSGFTHDHVQLLVMVASMFFAVKAAKSGLKGGLLWSGAYVLVVEAGKRINYSINLIVGLTLLYVGYTTLDFILERSFGRRIGLLYPVYVSFVVLGLFAFGRTVLPSLVEGNLSALPQGRMGSADIMPVNLLTLWLRYNVILFLLPFGVIAAYHRSDIFGITLTLIGFMLAGIMDRGTRIGDIGVALVLAYALLDWGIGVRRRVVASEAAKIGYLGAAVFLSIFARLATDFTFDNRASMPKTTGWDFGPSFYPILAASAVMAYLFWRKVKDFTKDGFKVEEYSLKGAYRRTFGRLSERQIIYLLASAAVLALAFSESTSNALHSVYSVASFFSSSALPVSLSLLSSAALPALAAAYLLVLVIERYMRKAWWGSGTALMVLAVLFMSLTTLFTVIILRMGAAKTVEPEYILVFTVIGTLSILIGFKELRTKATYALSILVFTYVTHDVFANPGFEAGKATIMGGYMLIFLTCGAALLHIVTKFAGDDKVLPAIATVLVLSMAVNLYYIHTVESRRVGPNKEYEILNWLAKNNKGGKILTAWDHGYMAEVVSGLSSVSTPGGIDNRTHSLLWMPERQAALNFNNKGVRYILLNDETFNVVRDPQGQMMYRIMGGLILGSKVVPPPEIANRYTIYKLRHNLTEGYFKLLKSEKDPVTGMGLMLYEVEGEPSLRETNLTLIGGVAVNIGGNKTVKMMVSRTQTNGTYNQTYQFLDKESFKAGELKDVLYPVNGVPGWDCRLRPVPLNNRLWDFAGSLAYYNTGSERDVRTHANLVVQQTNEVVDTFERVEHSKAQEKRIIPLVFHNIDEWGEYAVDLVPGKGVSVLYNETSNPQLENVRVLAVFC